MTTQFSNKQILISELPDWQTVTFEEISSKYKSVVLIRYIIFMILYISIATIIYFANNEDQNFNLLYVLAGGLVLFIIFLLLNLWSMRYWGYALREHDMLYRTGIFSKSVKIIPFKQVQHVDIKEGAISRLFSLSSIEIHTAGVGEGLRVPGIAQSNVLTIQEYISQRINTKISL
jgi:membrane protein YdbS with pleckstrin-like domain